MLLFLSFVTLTLAGMPVASPLKCAPSAVVFLPAGEVNLVIPVENTPSLRELGMDSNLGKRSGANCSDTTLSSFISASYSEGKTLATGAIDYINNHGIGDELFITYFGAVQDSTMQLNIFTDVVNENSVTVSCSDPDNACPNSCDTAHLSTYVDGIDIYVCPGFYNQVDTGHLCAGTIVDSGLIRGATMLHEVTSAVDQTSWVQGGCSDARRTASSNPYAAARIGDNYSCFAMQVYVDTHCPS